MLTQTYYAVGTASVTSGETTVTFTGAMLGTASSPTLEGGDLFFDPAQPEIPGQRLASIDYVSGTGELWAGWPGATMDADPYEVRFVGHTERSTAQTRRYLERLGQLAALGIQPNAFGDFADRDAYDDEAKGFIFLAIGDPWTLYIKETDASGDWDAGQAVEGIDGPQGDTGLIGLWRNAWVTATAYAVNDAVSEGGSSYICVVAHTAGVFATDLAAIKWKVVAAKGNQGDPGVDGKFSGTELIKTAAYTALVGDVGKTIILNKATADTLSFSAAATLGATWMAMVKNIGAGTWVLDPSGAETIDGAATISLATGESCVVTSNGTALRSLFKGSVSASGVSNTPAGNIAATTVQAAINELDTEKVAAGAVRELLTANRTYYVGFNTGVAVVSIATPAVATKAAHGLVAGNRVSFSILPNNKAATISVASPAVVTATQSFVANQPIMFSTRGNLPTGVLANTTYYVLATGLSGASFQFSLTPGGAAINTTSPVVTISNASPGIITLAAHGLAIGDTVTLATTGALPTGLTAGVNYFVKTVPNANTFSVAATPDGTAINTSSAGSGVHTLVQSGAHTLMETGTLPTGITEGTDYYVLAAGLTTGAFQFSLTAGGAAINTSGTTEGNIAVKTGADTNTGLANNAANAFLTVQKALDVALMLDLGIFKVTIQVASGVYLQNLAILGQGNTRIDVIGAGYNQTRIGQGNGTGFAVQGACQVNLRDFGFADGLGVSLWLRYNATVYLNGSLRFGSATARAIAMDNGCYCESTGGTFYLNGNMPYFIFCVDAGSFQWTSGATVVIEKNITVTAFIRVSSLGIGNVGASITWVQFGVVTGIKYQLVTNGVFSASGNAALIPGSTAGSVGTGGQLS